MLTPIKTRFCSDQDIKERFQVKSSQDAAYLKNAYCADRQDEIQFAQHFFLGDVTWLAISIDRCVGKDYCKTEEEIDEFINSLQLLVLTKEMHYDPPDFENETPVKSMINSSILPVAFTPPRFQSIKIVRTDIESEERFVDLGILGT